MPPPHQGPTCSAGSRSCWDGRSVRPPPPASALPPSGRSCPRYTAPPAAWCRRRAAWVSPPLSPGAGSSCPNSSDSRSGTDCSSDRPRTRRASPRPPPAHPDWPSPADRPPTPPTWRSQTAFLTTSACPSSSSRTLVWLTQRTPPQTTGPFAPPPPRPAGASPLLRTGPPAHPGSVLNPSRGPPAWDAPSRHPRRTEDSHTGTRLLTFHARAADQDHVAYVPDATRPISGHPPGSSRSTPHTPRFRRHFDFDNDTSPAIPNIETAHRLPDPHLTHPLRLFRVAHHDGLQPTQHTVVWSLPPQGDSEGPNLHLSHSTASKNLAYITSSSQRVMKVWPFGVARREEAPADRVLRWLKT